MSINERIAELRKVKGYLQQTLADKIGVSRQTISNIENNKHSASSDILMRILKAFADINPRWLILGEGEIMTESSGVAQEPFTEYENKYKNKLIESLERENKLLQKELERLKKECNKKASDN